MIFDEENFPELPASWTAIGVSLACSQIVVRQKIPTKNYLAAGPVPVIDQGAAVVGGYWGNISSAVDTTLPVIVFGDHTRALKYIDFRFAAGADGIKVLRPYEFFDPRIFFRFMQAIRLPNRGYSRHFQFLRSSRIALPPINEQKRIADKLDAVLARVDACREHLDRVPAILKRFRQSVLAAATSGRLTEDWRSDNGAGNWQQTDVQSVAQVGTGSTPLRSNPSFFASTGTPWITSAATSRARVTQADEFVTAAAITAHRLRIYPPGTLLVAMYGEGKTRGQVTELGISATINQACAAVIVDPAKAVTRYVKLVLQANYLEMRELAEGGNQPNLNLSKIKEFPLPLPDLNEQAEIVRRVDSLFAWTDRLEARLTAARSQADRLTPSLLAKAFRGELVAQDPTDEPATELLARLAQASGTTKAARGRRPAR